MERFVKGDVVVLSFPFSDLTNAKKRPALVISVLDGYDLILSQITSQFIMDNYSIIIDDRDFESGNLKQISNVRPNRLFTADTKIIHYKIGRINSIKLNDVINKIIDIIKD